MTLVAIGVGVAMLAAAFFAVAEIALLSAGRLRLRRWVRRALEGQGWADPEDVVTHPYRLLSPILAGHVLAVVLGATLAARLAGPRVANPLAAAALCAVPLALGIHLLETVGGAAARVRADRLLPALSFLLRACARAFLPFVAGANALVGRALAWSGARVEGGPVAGRRALEELLDESERAGIVESSERQIIAGVFAFGSTPVAAVMHPVERTVAAPAGSRARAIAQILFRTGQSRVAIHGRDPRRIVGMVHLFDVFRLAPDERPHPRRVVTTALDTPCDEVLVAMRRQRTHLAVVAEEGTARGTVALEDLVEVLIGEIRQRRGSRASRR